MTLWGVRGVRTCCDRVSAFWYLWSHCHPLHLPCLGSLGLNLASHQFFWLVRNLLWEKIFQDKCIKIITTASLSLEQESRVSSRIRHVVWVGGGGEGKKKKIGRWLLNLHRDWVLVDSPVLQEILTPGN